MAGGMAMRISTRRFLTAMILALLFLTAACSKPAPEMSALTWSGKGLEGLRFFARVTGGVTVWYAPPTSPERAEGVANAARSLLERHRPLGRVIEGESLTVWIVPAGSTWPGSLPPPLPGRGARAAAPRAVVIAEPLAETSSQPGLDEAMAVGLTQSHGSPAFTVDWLHTGVATATVAGWSLFDPNRNPSLEPEELLKRLEGSVPKGSGQFDEAAWLLTGLAMDRWGLNWTGSYRRTPEQLTPRAVLLWTAGTDDLPTALTYWKERMWNYVGPENRSFAVGPQRWRQTAADLSPVRMNPALSALPAGPGPNPNYSPHHYDLDVRYDSARRMVEGQVQLTWTNGEGIPLDMLYFNLWPNAEQFAFFGAGLTVVEVMVDGKAAAYTTQGLDLAVPLGRAVVPGEEATVVITFSTRLPQGISDRNFGQDGTRFNLTQWYPILAVLDDRGWVLHGMNMFFAEPYSEIASYHVRLDVPAGTVVGATGRQVARQEQGNRWVYAYDAPNFREFVVSGGTELKETVRSVDGVQVHLLHADDEWIKTVGDHIEQGLAFYNRTFGKYPYGDLVVSCCRGMEWPGLLFTSELPKGEGEMERFLYVTYHELGHQWFYGVVGNDQYHEPWIDEGFTTYADRRAFRSFGWAPYGGNLRTRTLSGVQKVTASQYEIMRAGGNTAVYFMGALALEDLEAMLGQPLMDRLMQEWYRRYTFKTATTADFIGLAEEVSGRDLRQFFRDHKVFPEDRGTYRLPIPLGKALPFN